jgi:hypothetical protein
MTPRSTTTVGRPRPSRKEHSRQPLPGQQLAAVLQEAGAHGGHDGRRHPAAATDRVRLGGRVPLRRRTVETAQVGTDEQRGAGEKGEHAEEHPPPRDVVRQQAGHRRPDEGGQDPPARGGREDPRPQRRRKGPRDDHVDGHDVQAAPEALHGARHHEDPHLGRDPGEQQPGGEGHGGRHERGDRAAAVAHVAGDHHAQLAGGEEDREGQAVEPQTVQLAGGDRHRRRDRDRLEGHRDYDADHPDDHRPVLRCEEPRPQAAVDRHGGRCGLLGHADDHALPPLARPTTP